MEKFLNIVIKTFKVLIIVLLIWVVFMFFGSCGDDWGLDMPDWFPSFKAPFGWQKQKEPAKPKPKPTPDETKPSDHKCGHVCVYENADGTLCLKCTDPECKDAACKDKCPGHHVCEHKCDYTYGGGTVCGKCTDGECEDEACKEKCAGHGHCIQCEICGKCWEEYCLMPECQVKCTEHKPVHEIDENKHYCYTCKYVYADGTRCDKCTDPDCEDEKCKDKCPGHEDHQCSHGCPWTKEDGEKCGLCRDPKCTDEECKNKCMDSRHVIDGEVFVDNSGWIGENDKGDTGDGDNTGDNTGGDNTGTGDGDNTGGNTGGDNTGTGDGDNTGDNTGDNQGGDNPGGNTGDGDNTGEPVACGAWCLDCVVCDTSVADCCDCSECVQNQCCGIRVTEMDNQELYDGEGPKGFKVAITYREREYNDLFRGVISIDDYAGKVVVMFEPVTLSYRIKQIKVYSNNPGKAFLNLNDFTNFVSNSVYLTEYDTVGNEIYFRFEYGLSFMTDSETYITVMPIVEVDYDNVRLRINGDEVEIDNIGNMYFKYTDPQTGKMRFMRIVGYRMQNGVKMYCLYMQETTMTGMSFNGVDMFEYDTAYDDPVMQNLGDGYYAYFDGVDSGVLGDSNGLVIDLYYE